MLYKRECCQLYSEEFQILQPLLTIYEVTLIIIISSFFHITNKWLQKPFNSAIFRLLTKESDIAVYKSDTYIYT